MNYKTLSRGLVLVLVSFFINGCAGPMFGNGTPNAVVRIKATKDMNPDLRGRPSPIVLRLYSLKSDNSFNDANFYDLFEDAKSILGNDFINPREIEISPTEIKELAKIKLDKDTRYLGILAAYRDIDNAIWRGVIRTRPGKTTYIDITLGKLSMSVAEGNKRSQFMKE